MHTHLYPLSKCVSMSVCVSAPKGNLGDLTVRSLSLSVAKTTTEIVKETSEKEKIRKRGGGNTVKKSPN